MIISHFKMDTALIRNQKFLTFLFGEWTEYKIMKIKELQNGSLSSLDNNKNPS